MYQHISLKALRPQLPSIIDRVDKEMERYIISKRGQPVAVLVSLDDFESLIETLNEESDKNNLKRIRKGLQEARRGQTVDWKKVKSKYRL